MRAFDKRPCRDKLTPVGDIEGCIYSCGHYGDHKSIVDGVTYLWDVCRQEMCLQWEIVEEKNLELDKVDKRDISIKEMGV